MPAVFLREVEDDDSPYFFEWQADEESFLMAAVPARDAEACEAHWPRIRGIRESTLQTILADGFVVGNAMGWTCDEGRVVGYWIGREHWARASRATRSLCSSSAAQAQQGGLRQLRE